MRQPALDTTATLNKPRVQVWPAVRIAVLALGDVLMFVLFAVIGRLSHHETSGLAAPADIATTAAPFALGWLVVAPALGAYRRGRTDTVARMLVTTEVCWVLAWPATLVLRWIVAADHRVPVSFALVILLTNALLLGGWRGLFAAVESAWRRVGGERNAT